MEKILKLMKEMKPDLSVEAIDRNTSLNDIWFDVFYCEVLARRLKREYDIEIPDDEVDAWQKVGDIVASVEKRCEC